MKVVSVGILLDLQLALEQCQVLGTTWEIHLTIGLFHLIVVPKD